MSSKQPTKGTSHVTPPPCNCLAKSCIYACSSKDQVQKFRLFGKLVKESAYDTPAFVRSGCAHLVRDCSSTAETAGLLVIEIELIDLGNNALDPRIVEHTKSSFPIPMFQFFISLVHGSCESGSPKEEEEIENPD